MNRNQQPVIYKNRSGKYIARSMIRSEITTRTWQFKIDGNYKDRNYYCVLECSVTLDKIIGEEEEMKGLQLNLKLINRYREEKTITKVSNKAENFWAQVGWSKADEVCWSIAKPKSYPFPTIAITLHTNNVPSDEKDIRKEDVNRFCDYRGGQSLGSVSSVTNLSGTSASAVIMDALGLIPYVGTAIDIINLIYDVTPLLIPGSPQGNQLPSLSPALKQPNDFAPEILVQDLRAVLKEPNDMIVMALYFNPGRCRTNRTRRDTFHIKLKLPLVMWHYPMSGDYASTYTKWVKILISEPSWEPTKDYKKDFDIVCSDSIPDLFGFEIRPCWPTIQQISNPENNSPLTTIKEGDIYRIYVHNFDTAWECGEVAPTVKLGNKADYPTATLVEQEILGDINTATTIHWANIKVRLNHGTNKIEPGKCWLYVTNDMGHPSEGYKITTISK